MKLYIIRHAIAVELGTQGFNKDNDRPLTAKGAAKMHKIARGLNQLDVKLELILSSPYVRARETAKILAEVLKIESKITYTETLTPVGNPKQLIMEINKLKVENLALVGHEPDLSSLISLLVSGNPELPISLKKGGICRLDVDKLIYGRCATLEWLLTPPHLISIGA